MSIKNDIEAAAKAAGATVKEVSPGHFQIRGRLLVNYYPTSKYRSAYVAGTTKAVRRVTPTDAVAMAFTPPAIVSPEHKDKRRKGSKKYRQRMLHKFDKCHWCGCKMTLENSSIEHIIPLYRGGLDNANNRVLSCIPCNQARGHNMPELKGQ